MPFLGTPFSIDRLLGLHLFDSAIGLAGQKLPPNQAASEARKRPAAASASTTSSSASSFYNFSTSPSSHSLSSALSLLGLIAQNPVPSPSVPAADLSPELPIATWPMAQLPVEIFEIITRYLTRAEVKALRLVCREFEAKVSAQYFRNVVVPFRSELYTNLDHDENNALTSRLFSNGMRIFESFGPHILRFALSLELDEFTLAYPPVKPSQEAIPAFWGIYRWPHETYHRYTDLEGLEQTADETDGMKKALRCLTKVTNLGLCCDAGLGFLVGPDQAARKINNPDPVFDARDWRQDARPTKHEDAPVAASDFNGVVPRDVPGATAQHDNFKRRVLEKMISDAGFAGYYVHEAIELLLKTEGVSISTIDFDEREAVAGDDVVVHHSADSRRRGQRVLNHHHVNHHQQLQQQLQQHIQNHLQQQQAQQAQQPQQPQQQQLHQQPQQQQLHQQLHQQLQQHLQQQLQQHILQEMQPPPDDEEGEEPNQEQHHHHHFLNLHAQPIAFPQNVHGHLLPQPHPLQPHLQVPWALQQQDLNELIPEQFQFNALHNLPPNMPIHLLPLPVQQQLQQQLPPGFPLHLQLQPQHNRRIEIRRSETLTTAEINRQPLIPINLTRAQKELLLELEWAHRAMIQSYVISIIDNAGDGCFSNLTNVTIAKIPSAHIHILCRKELWERIPSVKNVSLAVIADWRKISKPSPGVVEDIHVSPVEAVSKVYRLLNDYIGRQPNIENLHFEWICGGEFAPGPYQRNQFILPAPIVESPDLMPSPGGAKETDKLLELPFVKQFSLKNCWAAPNFLFQTIRSMALRSLDKLEFESVSFSGPPNLSPLVANNNAGLLGEAPLPLAAIIPGMGAHGNVFPPGPLHAVTEEPPPSERLVIPNFLSWSGFCEHFSPGIKMRSLPLFDESPASEAFTRAEDLSPFLPDADRLRADEAQYGLSSITLRSCGYVFVDIRALDVRQILPTEGGAAHVYVNTYRHDIYHAMQCCRDKFLGRILPYMPVTEARSLELIWQMELGWSKVYSEQLCNDAIADGFDLPGMGRFSGTIEKLGDADVPMMTE